MDADWDRRFLITRELAEAVPALQALSLGYCQDTISALIGTVRGRAGARVDEVCLRLTVEILVAAWRTASLRRTGLGRKGGRARLAELVDNTFAELPAALT